MERETAELLKALEERHAALVHLFDDVGSDDSGDAALKARECLDILRKLQKVDMTTAILGQTNAGKRLKVFSKHPAVGAEAATLAKAIVAGWKAMVMSSRQSEIAKSGVRADVQAEEKTGMSQGPQDGGNLGGETTVGKGELESDHDAPGPRSSADPDASDEQILPNKPEPIGDSMRDKIRTRLFEALCVCRLKEGVVAGDGDHESSLACDIEQAMYSTLEGVSAKYKSKFQQLHFNLKDPKNPDLRKKVVTGNCGPSELLLLSPEELASDAKREENQRIRDKKLFDSAPSQAKQATTDQFQCGKCRQRKCTYYQMQTRSADEPMTTFVSCLNCGNKWKFC
jgi:transcription elongation factor S-II